MKPETGDEVRIERTFDAPRALVWRAWTEPARLARWFAPRACRIEVHHLDARAGGTHAYTVADAKTGAAQCRVRGDFREVRAPERLVFTMRLCDEAGNTIDFAQAGKDPEWPTETVCTVTFAEEGGKTKVTLHQSVLESLARRTGALPSWLEMLDLLAEELARG